MAFAVKDAKADARTYSRFLCVPRIRRSWSTPSRATASRSSISAESSQLLKSMDDDGRFATWIKERGGEGLHQSATRSTPSTALATRRRMGRRLRLCKPCRRLRQPSLIRKAMSHSSTTMLAASKSSHAGLTAEELEKYNAGQGDLMMSQAQARGLSRSGRQGRARHRRPPRDPGHAHGAAARPSRSPSS